MRFLIATIFLSILLLSLLSCSNKDNPAGYNDNNFIYPIKIGNKWEYFREYSRFNFRPDTLDVSQVLDDTVTSTVIISIARKETIFDSIQTYVFHEILTEEGDQTFEDESYYNNLAGGLYLYAYRGAGWVIPKSNVSRKILFKGRYFNSIREVTSFIEKALPNKFAISDTLIYEIPPIQSIKYPLETGSQWIIRQSGNPWRMDKKVLGKETVKVPAGDFNCWKIQWLYDIDKNGEWDNDIIFYDYICSEGLICRYIFFKDMEWRGEYNELIGLFDGKDESVLTSINF